MDIWWTQWHWKRSRLSILVLLLQTFSQCSLLIFYLSTTELLTVSVNETVTDWYVCLKKCDVSAAKQEETNFGLVGSFAVVLYVRLS